LSSGSALFPVGEEDVNMATCAEVNPMDLFFPNSFIFHVGDVDPSKISHPLPLS